MKYEILLDRGTPLEDPAMPVYLALRMVPNPGNRLEEVRLTLKPLEFCESVEPLEEYPELKAEAPEYAFLLQPHPGTPEILACFLLEVRDLPTPSGEMDLLQLGLHFREITAEGTRNGLLLETVSLEKSGTRPDRERPQEVISLVSEIEARKVLQTVHCMHHDGQDGQARRILDRHIQKWQKEEMSGAGLRALAALQKFRGQLA